MNSVPQANDGLRIDHLQVDSPAGDTLLHPLSLHIGAGEILGLIGESGSGKTTLATALLGHTRRGARIVAGRLTIGAQVHDLAAHATARARGRGGWLARLLGQRKAGRAAIPGIAYVPQMPGAHLNPSSRLQAIFHDLLVGPWTEAVEARLLRCLAGAGLPTERAFLHRFPHELSGGQQQRVALAAALFKNASVLILDEPTSGLDPLTASHVLETLLRLNREFGVALLCVSHDIRFIECIAHRIAVMRAGQVVEIGAADRVLKLPAHAYTRTLLAAIPGGNHANGSSNAKGLGGTRGISNTHGANGIIGTGGTNGTGGMNGTSGINFLRASNEAIAAHADQPLLAVRNLVAHHGARMVADQVSFSVGQGRWVALIGASGSGKTTVAAILAGLRGYSGGNVLLDGLPLPVLAEDRSRAQRRRIQIVLQDPQGSLNPRQTVRAAIARPLRYLRDLAGQALELEVARLAESVQLPANLLDCHVADLSGGECQRVSIARALAAQPDLLICDEITSALDVSVQAAILALLQDLRARLGLAILFITHQLDIVADLADDLVVLEAGRVIEKGAAQSVLAAPQADWTRRTLRALQRPETTNEILPRALARA